MSSVPPQTVTEIASAPARASRRRLRPRGRLLFALAAAAVVVVAVALVLTDPFAGSGTPGSGVADNAFATSVTTVSRRSLSSQTQVSATLSYAGTSTIVEPAGTAPATVLQAQQSVTTTRGCCRRPQATLVGRQPGALRSSQARLAAAGRKRRSTARSQRRPERLERRRGRRLGRRPVRERRADGVERPSRAWRRHGEGRERPDAALLGRQRAQRRAGRASRARSPRGALRSELDLHDAARARRDRRARPEPVLGQRAAGRAASTARSRAWRAFVSGMSAGADVGELNANLRALGYGKGLTGDTFTAQTASAIDAFQSAHGAQPDRGAAARLGGVRARAGAGDGGHSDRRCDGAARAGAHGHLDRAPGQIELDAAQQAEVKVGDPVSITLPNNQTTPGRVSYVGTVATVPVEQRPGRRRLEHTDDRGRRHADRPGRDRPSRPGARQRRRSRPRASATCSSCRSTRCSRSRAAATRSRRSAAAAHHLVRGQPRAVRRRRRPRPGERQRSRRRPAHRGAGPHEHRRIPAGDRGAADGAHRARRRRSRSRCSSSKR